MSITSSYSSCVNAGSVVPASLRLAFCRVKQGADTCELLVLGSDLVCYLSTVCNSKQALPEERLAHLLFDRNTPAVH